MDHAAHLFAVIGEHEDGIRDRLDDGQYALLRSGLQDLAGSQGDPSAVVRAVHTLRRALAPLAGDHPVWPALNAVLASSAGGRGGPVRATGAVLTRPTDRSPASPWQDETERHTPGLSPWRGPGRPNGRERATWTPTGGLMEPADIPASGPDTAAIIAEVQRRLLTAPSLSADEVRERCSDGSPPRELIRLDDPRRGTRYPAFQFALGPGGPPIPVVRQVNRVLLADIDPWGAADWWLSGNRWLGGPPVSCLGVLPDEALAGAAHALAEGD
ncbi:hypothetical protein [Streptomyces chrestomyceticus]|uniref:hypothetical protein n=1 Tax=Streptomyces chrestomyceticus TaxID=68185 RepID=UPI0033E817C5